MECNPTDISVGDTVDKVVGDVVKNSDDDVVGGLEALDA